ncbi:hypothetical protein Tco_1100458 [Tanacetum coccineum]
MKEKSTDFVTPIKASREAQEEEEISPTILEAAKTLSKVASQSVSKVKSTDKGKRYRRRARSVAKNINTGLDAKVEINTGIEEATHKTKEQIRQEEAGLEEAIKLQAQMDEEVAKQIHLDKMIAKRMAEEELLSEQQKKRKALVQFEAQFYTEEDWDAIRAKLEANTELTKDVLGKDLPEQDFAKRMVDMVNQRKKHFAEERAKANRNKHMTQSQLTGKRKKQKARKGISVDKNAQGDSEADKEELVEAMNPTPLAIKSNIVKYGTNRPEDAYDKVLWSDLRTMFDLPLNEDAIWSLPL